VFEVAVVVLVRLGVNDDGVIDAAVGHALEQVFGRGRVRGLVRRVLVVGELRVVLAGEAVEVRIDDGRFRVGTAGTGGEGESCGSGGEEIARRVEHHGGTSRERGAAVYSPTREGRETEVSLYPRTFPRASQGDSRIEYPLLALRF
jgi:hypothetical protein